MLSKMLNLESRRRFRSDPICSDPIRSVPFRSGRRADVRWKCPENATLRRRVAQKRRRRGRSRARLGTCVGAN